MSNAPRFAGDPHWDPDVRARVRQAVDTVLFSAREVVVRYGDEDGCYQEPPGIADGGDVTGVIAAVQAQVIQPLQRELDRAQAVLREVTGLLDDHTGRITAVKSLADSG